MNERQISTLVRPYGAKYRSRPAELARVETAIEISQLQYMGSMFLARAVGRLQNQLETREKRIEDLETDVCRYQYNLHSANDRNQALEKQCFESNGESEMWRERATTVYQQLIAAQGERERVSFELDRSQKRIGDFEETVTQMDTRRILNEIQHKRALATIGVELVIAREENAATSAKLDQSQQRTGDLQKVVNALNTGKRFDDIRHKDAITAINNELDAAREENADTSAKLDQSQQRTRDLQEKLDEATRRRDAYKLQHRDATQKLEEAVGLSQKLGADLEAARQQNDSLQEGNRRLEALVASLKGSIDMCWLHDFFVKMRSLSWLPQLRLPRWRLFIWP